jgi:predicted transposase YbfD/YdcC
MSSKLAGVFTIFENLTDPRMERTRRHALFDLVVVALCATIGGCNNWADIERFGSERLEWFRTFLRLENGIPSHDTFGRVFAQLDPAKLAECIHQWLKQIEVEIGKHVAIDGKTLRGSFDTAAQKNPLHLVSAWACEARLTLGQIATEAKSNEITAIPLLLELLDLKGATVTIDAMGCQKEIAAKVIEREGHYLLALKDNHPTLCEAVSNEFFAALDGEVRHKDLRTWKTVEISRGREEHREYFALPAPDTLPGFADWKDLKTIVMVIRRRTINGKETEQVHWFLSNLPTKIKRLAQLTSSALEYRERTSLGFGCHFYRGPESDSARNRSANLGHVATIGSVHLVTRHFGQR